MGDGGWGMGEEETSKKNKEEGVISWKSLGKRDRIASREKLGRRQGQDEARKEAMDPWGKLESDCMFTSL